MTSSRNGHHFDGKATAHILVGISNVFYEFCDVYFHVFQSHPDHFLTVV